MSSFEQAAIVKLLPLLVAPIVTAALLSTAAAASSVTIAAGRLAGGSAAGTEHFFGIPYAAAPIGPLRWRAPQAAVGWAGVRDATRVAPDCIQDKANNPPAMPIRKAKTVCTSTCGARRNGARRSCR